MTLSKRTLELASGALEYKLENIKRQKFMKNMITANIAKELARAPELNDREAKLEPEIPGFAEEVTP